MVVVHLLSPLLRVYCNYRNLPFVPVPCSCLTQNWPKSRLFDIRLIFLLYVTHHVSFQLWDRCAESVVAFVIKLLWSHTMFDSALYHVEYHCHASIRQLEYLYFLTMVFDISVLSGIIFVKFVHKCVVTCAMIFRSCGWLKCIPCRIHCTWVRIGR